MALNAVLEVEDLRVMVHLGVGDAERRVAQEIGVSLRFEFTELPPACATDLVEHTIDYFSLCKILKVQLTQKPYNTIEHMAQESLLAVQKELQEPLPGKLTLTLHKLNPPVEGLRGGARFQISGQL